MTLKEKIEILKGENGILREEIESLKKTVEDLRKENEEIQNRTKALRKDLRTVLQDNEKMSNDIGEILQRTFQMREADSWKTRKEHDEIIVEFCRPWIGYSPKLQSEDNKEADHDRSGSEGSSSPR